MNYILFILTFFLIISCSHNSVVNKDLTAKGNLTRNIANASSLSLGTEKTQIDCRSAMFKILAKGADLTNAGTVHDLEVLETRALDLADEVEQFLIDGQEAIKKQFKPKFEGITDPDAYGVRHQIVNWISTSDSTSKDYAKELLEKNNKLINELKNVFDTIGENVLLDDAQIMIDGEIIKYSFLTFYPNQDSKFKAIQMMTKFQERFDVKSIRFDLLDSAFIGYGGRYIDIYKRIDSPQNFINYLFNGDDVGMTIRHEFAHAMFKKRRERGIESIYHISFLAMDGKPLVINRPTQYSYSMYSISMSAEEYYNSVNNIFWPTNFDIKNASKSFVKTMVDLTEKRIKGLKYVTFQTNEISKSILEIIKDLKRENGEIKFFMYIPPDSTEETIKLVPLRIYVDRYILNTNVSRSMSKKITSESDVIEVLKPNLEKLEQLSTESQSLVQELENAFSEFKTIAQSFYESEQKPTESEYLELENAYKKWRQAARKFSNIVRK